MNAWWSARSPRERFLLTALGVVAALVGYWQFGLVPMRSAAESAQTRYQTAIGSARAIEAAAERLSAAATVASSPEDDQRPLRGELEDAAGALGVTISRAQPETNGDVTVWVDSAPAGALLGWIARLSAERGVAVRRLNLQRAQGDRVQAEITFGRGGA